VAVVGVSDQQALTQIVHELAALGKDPLALRADVRRLKWNALSSRSWSAGDGPTFSSTTRGLFTPASEQRSVKRRGVRPWRCTSPAPSCAPKLSCQS
jgi:hypothetical protein